MSNAREVVLHLRALRAHCARGLAWCSALIWAEKALLLSDDIDDLLWLVDALVTNGQYRQTEELLLSPVYGLKVRASTRGRHLASVVAMRLGRAEDALELLSIDAGWQSGPGILPPIASNASVTPTAKRPLASSRGANSTSLLDSLVEEPADDGDPLETNSAPPLEPRAWTLYMQGAAAIQLSNVGAGESTPTIKLLNAQLPRVPARRPGSLGMGHATPTKSAVPRTESAPAPHALGGMDSLVARLWTEAVRVDARCWEAWTGLRDYGLLTGEEEMDLVDSVDWAQCCGGSIEAGRFFRNYCLATQTAYSLSNPAVEATRELLSTYPRLSQDPALRTIHAARLLSQGLVRESLGYTAGVLERRRVPDASATAIHITALTVLHAKDALFRIAHELAEEFGLSAVKRAEIEPSDTGSTLPPSTAFGLDLGGSGKLAGSTPVSTPRNSSIGGAVAGTGRLRAGARGLLVPDTPSKATPGSTFGNAGAASATAQRTGMSGSAAQAIARSVVQSTSATAAAAWRGLWGLPTWTHPGPPVLATYPSALGPAQSAPTNPETPMSTLGIFTTSNAQSAGSPTQYEFVGASLAWYAIGCYYLVSAALTVSPEASQCEWILAGKLYGNQRTGANVANGNPVQRRAHQPLTPEAEHALTEARRWLAKTTLASPRSIVAWVAFAHTFIVAGDWESAIRALHTAVGLCGCEGFIHGGGRDATKPNLSRLQTPSKPNELAPDDLLTSSDRPGAAGPERGSQLAHTPLASLGSVYLQMGDLSMAESCLDASARCLSGYRITEWLAAWSPVLEPVKNSRVLSWCSGGERVELVRDDSIRTGSLADPQLLSDVGVLYYSSNDLVRARSMFILGLLALESGAAKQHALHSAFGAADVRRASGRKQVSTAPEQQALSALFKANLGNTLRRMGDYTAALKCLQAAALHAPSDTDIQLSIAFTLHSRALEGVESGTNAGDLDQAIDMYHQVLAERPGDPVATDLLTLALEASVVVKNIDALAGSPGADTDDDLFVLKSPEEIGLLAVPGSDGDALSSGYNSQSDAPQLTDQASQASQQTSDASLAEDSDEVMDIEEDSDESDMAMD
ncbi:anaphase-promoting complex subunit Cut9 [Coemansia sp. RSA 552]|nr:anaphase-promoting complex subunit Cut9 [Coemansia sp. RSA 552]